MKSATPHFQDGLYNRAVYLPPELLTGLADRQHHLTWSDHAREQVFSNKLTNPVKVLIAVPNPLPLKFEDVVEVTMLDGAPYKVVIRKSLDEKTDICVVFNIRNGVVKTCWFNSKKDQHDSLDPAPYVKKPV